MSNRLSNIGGYDFSSTFSLIKFSLKPVVFVVSWKMCLVSFLIIEEKEKKILGYLDLTGRERRL